MFSLHDVRLGSLGIKKYVHHNLEAVEASSFGSLDLGTKSLDEVFVDDTVRRSEESENMRDKMTLVVVELVFPVVLVLGKVHLFCSPEGSLGLFVHLPDL